MGGPGENGQTSPDDEDQGTVYVQGSGDVTVTVESYSTDVDTSGAAQRRRHRRGCDRHKKCGSKVSGEAPSVRGLLSFRCSQSLCYENNFPEKVKYFKNFGQKSTVCLNNAQKNCRFFGLSTILLKTLSFL